MRNTGHRALTAGWTLWFTAIGDTVSADPAFAVRRVTGSLHAVTAPVSLGPLAPGHTVSIAIDHPGAVLRDDKGPTGPYLTTAQDAAHALAISHFTRKGPRRATPGAPAMLYADPAQTYRDNQAWQQAVAVPPVLPTPKVWQISGAATFPARLAAPRIGAGLAGEAVMARRLAAAGGKGLSFAVAIGPVAGEMSAEAYHLSIGTKGVALTGVSAAGVAYGLGALEQILRAARAHGGRLQALEINDAPRFPHRGLMIDVARNFREPSEIRRIIDLMAALRLNRLHLHLTDDEGWRLEIPALPELTTVGARRGHFTSGVKNNEGLPPAVGSGPDVHDRHGSGYFTGADYVGLLRYAAARHIEVIPEIDMPGHARAAIRAMAARDAAHPEEHGRFRLSDPDDTSHYVSAQGYTDNALDPSLPSSLRFVEVVVDELARLHDRAGVPLRRLHIGGDEVAAGAWQGSPAAKAQLAASGAVPALDPATPAGKAALWSAFFAKVLAVLAPRGIAATGWDELGVVPGTSTANPAFAKPGTTVQLWSNGAVEAGLDTRLLAAGYDLILSPASDLYLDMAQAPDPEEPGHDWARPLPLAQVFAYDPELAHPRAGGGQGHLLGIEATLFSETVRGGERLDRMLMPRLLAVAERAWAPQPAWAREADPERRKAAWREDWGRFSRQLGETALPALAERFAWRYRIPAPGAVVEGRMVRANVGWPGLTLHFERGARQASARSPVMSGPLMAGPVAAGRMTIVAVAPDGRTSAPTTIDAAP